MTSGRGGEPQPPTAGRGVWLPTSPDPTFALLHEPPAGLATSVAVLICGPFGHLDTLTYRNRRDWAEGFAAAGYPAVRLHYPSLGDSGGTLADPGRLSAWTDSVSAAADWLRRLTGCRRVVALGIELGGLLACAALADGAAIDDLILWSVRPTGKGLVREMRLNARIIAETERRRPAEPDDPTGSLELLGYTLSAQTRGELESLDLADLAWPSARDGHVLILQRPGRGVAEPLRAHFADLGAEVEVVDAGDFSAIVGPPGETTLPPLTIPTTVAWLDRLRAAAEAPAPVSDALDTSETAAPVSDALDASETAVQLDLDGTTVSETVLTFPISGTERGFAIVTAPADRTPIAVTAVFLNAGGNPHLGPNREHVEVARLWAARGITTVRADLEGVGDADGGDPLVPLRADDTHSETRAAQISTLLDALAAHGCPARFAVAGISSGAYLSLRVALADARVTAAASLNAAVLLPGDQELLAAAVLRTKLRQQLRSSRPLSRGQLQTIKHLLSRRVLRGTSPIARHRRARTIDAMLDTLRDRDVQLLILTGANERVRHDLTAGGQLRRQARWPNVRFALLDSQDHLLRSPDDNRALVSELSAWIDRVPADV